MSSLLKANTIEIALGL